jgi:hypothetical protein
MHLISHTDDTVPVPTIPAKYEQENYSFIFFSHTKKLCTIYVHMCVLCKALTNYQKLLQIQTHRIGIQILIQTRVRVLTTNGKKLKENIFKIPFFYIASSPPEKTTSCSKFEIVKKNLSHPQKNFLCCTLKHSFNAVITDQ